MSPVKGENEDFINVEQTLIGLRTDYKFVKENSVCAQKDPVKGENEKNEDYDCHSNDHTNYHDYYDYDADYFLQREFDEDETEAINEFVFNNMFE